MGFFDRLRKASREQRNGKHGAPATLADFRRPEPVPPPALRAVPAAPVRPLAGPRFAVLDDETTGLSAASPTWPTATRLEGTTRPFPHSW